jgi:hypothetical protein
LVDIDKNDARALADDAALEQGERHRDDRETVLAESQCYRLALAGRIGEQHDIAAGQRVCVAEVGVFDLGHGERLLIQIPNPINGSGRGVNAVEWQSARLSSL